jgi:hypothetical protein
MIGRLLVGCALGAVEIDLSEETGSLVDERLPPREPVGTGLPLVVDTDVLGSRVVCVVDRRPPLVVSDDAGTTWRETGGGLPPGRAVAISPDHPDRIAFATAERLYISEDGGRFWRVLAVELPEITAIRWLDTTR